MPLHDQVICGDAFAVLKGLPAGCADALISDPPAAIAMMQMAWDSNKGGRDQWIAWLAGIMAEARRCVRPGAHALVWALPRTSHWTATAMEDAKWRVVDIVTHVQSQGFPKSRSLLKPAAEHWILCRAPGPRRELNIAACRVPSKDSTMRSSHAEMGYGGGNRAPVYTTGSDRGRWPSNFALSHVPPGADGTGGCRPAGVRRVHGNGHYPARRGTGGLGTAGHSGQDGLDERVMNGEEVQAYLCVEGCAVKVLDEQAGPRTSGVKKPHHRRHAAKGWSGPYRDDQDGPAFRSFTGGDTGAASRFFPTFPAADPEPEDAMPFFYSAKASRRERSAGLPDGERSTHPTVKPLALGRWLTRLVAAPGSVVLDPFCGSGSLSAAAVLEGCHYIAVDCDESYCAIARARIAWAQQHRDGPLFAGAEREA